MTPEYKNKNKRFWTEDAYIDTLARFLSLKAQSVLNCLQRHANAARLTNVGTRKISEEMGIDFGTAKAGLKELIEKHFVRPRTKNSAHGFYYLYPLGETFTHLLGESASKPERICHPELGDVTHQKE